MGIKEFLRIHIVPTYRHLIAIFAVVAIVTLIILFTVELYGTVWWITLAVSVFISIGLLIGGIGLYQWKSNPMNPMNPNYTPVPTQYTPVPTQYTPVPTKYTPVPTQYTPVPTQYTPVPTQYTPVPTQYTPVPTQYTPVPPQYTPVPPQYTPVPPQYTPVPPQYTPVPPSNDEIAAEDFIKQYEAKKRNEKAFSDAQGKNASGANGGPGQKYNSELNRK
jgi:hypothetical protein